MDFLNIYKKCIFKNGKNEIVKAIYFSFVKVVCMDLFY